jgi:hypothetical protein
MTEEQKKQKIIGEKSHDFKVINADGVYTWFGDGGGVLTFFYDTFEPEINDDGSLTVKTIKRVFPVEIRMNPNLYKDVITWMSDRVKANEELKKTKKK